MLNTSVVSTPRGSQVQVLSGGSGPLLIYLHGAGGVLPEDPLLAELSQNFLVYAPLLPGYGLQEPYSNPDPQLRDMLDFTLHSADVCKAIAKEASAQAGSAASAQLPLLVGHSMGGMIAAEIAAIEPALMGKLVLLAPAGMWRDDEPCADLFAMTPGQFPKYLLHDPKSGQELLNMPVLTRSTTPMP